jgi:carbamoyl-phosphate synthase large subunit
MPQSPAEEGIETVLINPNIATIQTDPRLSGKVYLLPVTPEFVEKVIKKNAPTASSWALAGKPRLTAA